MDEDAASVGSDFSDIYYSEENSILNFVDEQTCDMATGSYDYETTNISVDVSDSEFDEMDYLNRAQIGDIDSADDSWFRNLFDDDQDKAEFEGFHTDWIENNFLARPHPPNCSVIGGSTFQHPEEYSALDYFTLIWDRQVG